MMMRLGGKRVMGEGDGFGDGFDSGFTVPGGAKEGPQVAVRGEFLRVEGCEHGADGGEGRFEDEGVDW